MKATIIQPDGTRIEAEGTPEEVAKLASPLPTFVPMMQPICTCMGGLLAGSWCPVHGYQRTYPVVYPVIYGSFAQPNVAAAANPTTVFLGTINAAGELS